MATTTTPIVTELGFTPPPAGSPNCATCPSALTSAEMVEATGKAISAPVCAIKLLPLIRPDQSSKVRLRAVNTISKGCADYGKPRPEFDPGAIRAPIMYGPIGFGKPNPGIENAPAVRNCVLCSNYIAPQEVASATGFNAGLCAAKGKLLMVDRLPQYAQGCTDSRGIAPNGRAKISNFVFFPEYTKTFGEIDKAALAKRSRSIQPLDWPTDKAVTADDATRGIKSWRRIDDPEGEGQPTYIPIYHPDTFPPEEQKIIPKSGDREHPELYHDYSGSVYQMAVMLMELDQTPAAWGPPGVGKTEIGRHLAWLMQTPFARLSVTETTEVDELFGKMMYHPDRGTYFQYGRLPQRWSRPGVICLDEPNTGQNAIWQRIRPLTDNSRQMVLDEGDQEFKEVIDRHRDCWFYLAMNPAWSPLNVGTNTIGDADARRLLHLYMDLPPAPIEKEIITERCMVLDGFDPTPHIENIMKIAEDIRRMSENGELPITWGIANQIKVARLMKFFSPMKAYRAAVLDYLDPAVALQVVQSINSYYAV